MTMIVVRRDWTVILCMKRPLVIIVMRRWAMIMIVVVAMTVGCISHKVSAIQRVSGMMMGGISLHDPAVDFHQIAILKSKQLSPNQRHKGETEEKGSVQKARHDRKWFSQ